MKSIRTLAAILILSTVFSCQDLLNPKPVNELTEEIILTSPEDVEGVRLGLYNAFRGIAAPKIVVGDFTADMITHNGTFIEYQELGNKQLTSSNSIASSLWGAIYRTLYISNFILDRLPALGGVPVSTKRDVLATARYLRGYALFVGAYTFGAVPLTTSTDLKLNETLPRTSKEEILKFVLDDYIYALENIPNEPVNISFAGKNAVRASLAQFYLYQEDWAQAETYATQIINSEDYTLDTYYNVVHDDDSEEIILKVGYSVSDDPGTTILGLNDIFVGRREVIPANKILNELYSEESGDRDSTVRFNIRLLTGSDNGWSVVKYGSVDDGNNDITIYRLGEIYLIRAEARARLGKFTGIGSAEEDINALRTRAKAPLILGSSVNQMLSIIERERVMELAYEGHRWYDLVRTGRVNTVMSSFNSNWKETYNLWPVPLRELQNNPSLSNDQNPGY